MQQPGQVEVKLSHGLHMERAGNDPAKSGLVPGTRKTPKFIVKEEVLG